MKLRVRPDTGGQWYWSLTGLSAKESAAAEREGTETHGVVASRNAGKIRGEQTAKKIRADTAHFAADPLEIEV